MTWRTKPLGPEVSVIFGVYYRRVRMHEWKWLKRIMQHFIKIFIIFIFGWRYVHHKNVREDNLPVCTRHNPATSSMTLIRWPQYKIWREYKTEIEREMRTPTCARPISDLVSQVRSRNSGHWSVVRLAIREKQMRLPGGRHKYPLWRHYTVIA